jgi:hypothetical protein
VRKAALLTLLIGVTLIGGCTFRSHVIDLTLVNNGKVEARNVEFRYPGGSFGVASLAPGQSYEYKIKPFYNGSVEVEFQYGGAKVRSTISRVEKDQQGKARVVFDETGVKWDGFRREH